MTTRRLLVVDAKAVPWWQVWKAEPWFQAGALYADWKKLYDDVRMVKTPTQLFDTIEELKPVELHLGGHGSPGCPLIGGKRVRASEPSWSHVKRAWFRSCEVGCLDAGVAFVEQLGDRGVDVAVHLARISGAGQSYLVGARAGRPCWWSRKLRPGSSHPFLPRTVFATDTWLPSWAFEVEAAGRGFR